MHEGNCYTLAQRWGAVPVRVMKADGRWRRSTQSEWEGEAFLLNVIEDFKVWEGDQTDRVPAGLTQVGIWMQCGACREATAVLYIEVVLLVRLLSRGGNTEYFFS